MNAFRVGIYFVLFFIGFFAASVLRFQRIIFSADHSLAANIPLFLIAAASGGCLALGLGELNLFSKAIWKKAIYGSTIGIIFFFSFFAIEDFLSDQRLYSDPKPSSFAEVRGHCGVYVGRALLQIYYWNWSPSLSGIVGDFRMGNRCRIVRFLELSKRGKLSCQTDEDAVQCVVRWMPTFADRGNWNADVRRMFLAEVGRLYKESRMPASNVKIAPESLVQYALKDYELDTARPTLVKQAGLEEEFSDEFMFYKQADEFQNVVVTKDVFDAVTWTLQNETAGPHESPLILKFKEAAKEVAIKNEKIPELERDLNELKKRTRF